MWGNQNAPAVSAADANGPPNGQFHDAGLDAEIAAHGVREGFREMTRYSNPLPHSQVPNTQGRPAGPGQQGQAPQYEQPAWPAPNGVPRTGRPAGFPDTGYADPQTGGQQAGAQHDPYAALRPDGYGYGQQPQPTADPYGLAGYTAPQPQQGYGRAPQPAQQPSFGSADPYGAGNGYGAAGQASPYGSPSQPSHGYAAPAHSFGSQAPSAAPQPQTSYGASYGTPPADHWGSPNLSVDARDYGQGYGAQQGGQWGTDHYGEPQLGPAAGFQGGQQPQHGAFDQSYAEDEAQYEDEPRRGGWKKIVALVACTVLVGGVLTIAYSSIMSPGDGKETPLVKGATGPSKVKPSEPGGKQFAHADSKLLGRLGEGGSEESADASGVRKVPVVTVGRDGTIQPPSPTEPEGTRAVVAVPGLTVIDGLGGAPGAQQKTEKKTSPQVQMVASSEPNTPVVVAPPKEPKKTAVADPAETGAVEKKAAPAKEPPPKKEKVAAVAPPSDAPAASGPKPTGAGYVAVLASVPASGNSRIEALKQFADMQQKYGTILQNKTPDVQEANLGEKGTYHRLLVGPPGSRDSASSVCTQLKAQGYSGCWVTAY